MQAVESALWWLGRHQSRDGSWSCANFESRCTQFRCGGAGTSDSYTTGTTGLALLAFLGAGNSPRHGRHKGEIKRGLQYLSSVQTPDGCIGAKVADGHYLYGHAIGTLVFAETYATTHQSPMYKRPLQRGVAYLLAAQNPGSGWRYGIRPGDNDTSVTAWVLLALEMARLAGAEVPDSAFAGGMAWINRVTDDSFFKTGYTTKGDRGGSLPDLSEAYRYETPTAMAMLCRLRLGTNRGDAVIRGGTNLLRGCAPRRSDPAPLYWLFGSAALWHTDGVSWRRWDDRAVKALLASQRNEHAEIAGSWDPAGPWGDIGGRVYTTAANALTLATPVRYPRYRRSVQRPAGKRAIGE